MKKRNISDINKFLIENDEIKEYNNSQNTLKTEGNQFINTPPQNNKNNLLSNSKYMKANYNTVKNKTQNKNKQLINKSYLDMIKYIEEELSSLDSEKHIKSAVKILENFQNELIEQLEQEYDENSIKKVLQSNFDKIIKMLINYFTIYDNKCAYCITNLKKMLKNKLTINRPQSNTNTYINSNSNSNKSAKIYRENIHPFDEEKKRELLNGEEIIVSLINSLSSGIKTCNKNYRTTVIEMAKLIEETNSGLIELKNKLDNLSMNLKSKTNINDINFKKNE